MQRAFMKWITGFIFGFNILAKLIVPVIIGQKDQLYE